LPLERGKMLREVSVERALLEFPGPGKSQERMGHHLISGGSMALEAKQLARRGKFSEEESSEILSVGDKENIPGRGTEA